MGLKYQIIGSIIICCTSLNIGVAFMWPAFTIMLFQSEHTPLHRPMTDTEISLLGSLSSVGSFVYTMATGFLLDKLGRKKCCIVSSMCVVVFWSILVVTRRVELVLAGVFISGLSNSGILIASVYVSEICQDSIRGFMCSSILTFNGLGIAIAYLLGGYLDYKMTVYIGMSMAIGTTALLFLLKDSPSYLMLRGKEEETLQSLAFYRQSKSDDRQLVEEINILKRSLNRTLYTEVSTELPQETEKLNDDIKPIEKFSFWQFMKKSKSSQQALMICLIIMSSSIYQGQAVLLVYIEPLFKVALPTMSASLTGVLMALVRVGASFISGYLSDITGRKPLMIYGSIGAAICCALLGSQLHLNWGPTWITLMSIYMFCLTFTIGAGTIPMVLMSELFLPEVKSILSMVCIEVVWVSNFTLLFFFNPAVKVIGWGTFFYIFAAICFITAIYTVFFVPETKGLTAEDIQPLLVKKKDRSHL